MVFRCFLFLALMINLPVFSQEVDFDKELRKELGIKEPTQPKSENQTLKPVQEENPVQERFQPKEEESSGNLLWILIKISMVLSIFVAMFYYIFKFFSRTKDSLYPVKGVMRVLSSLPIGPGKELQIVDLSGTLLLLGVSENSINLIQEIQSADLKQKIYLMRDTESPSQDSFVDQLIKNLKVTGSSSSTNDSKKSEDLDSSDVLKELKLRQLDRLESIKKERQNLSKKDTEKNFEKEKF
jgi:flagellar protein FliO/FliZ